MPHCSRIFCPLQTVVNVGVSEMVFIAEIRAPLSVGVTLGIVSLTGGLFFAVSGAGLVLSTVL